jgi:hypothetical protein
VISGETLAEIAHRYATPVSSLTSANQPAAVQTPEPGDLLVIPVASRFSRGSSRAAGRNAIATAHARPSRRAMASHRTPANAPVRRSHASAYRTASLSSKHRAAAN